MKRTALLLFVLLLSWTSASAQSSIKMDGKDDVCGKWIEKHFNKSTTPPFSFVYDGVSSEMFIKKWDFTKGGVTSNEDGSKSRSFFWKDAKSGLEVECQVKNFNDFNAMEWVIWFRNKGKGDCGQITDVRSVDLKLASNSKADDWTLFYANGSSASKEDFMARSKKYAVGDSLIITPDQGRSSCITFPFFNVKTPEDGMVVAIGWTGSWKAEIFRSEANNFKISTGLKNLDTYLRPGEEIRTPLTAMIPWTGEDRMDGQNIFRQFVLKYHFPKNDGKPFEAPICSGFDYGDPSPCNEYTCLTANYATALIHRYEEFNLLPEVFWLDAGWYERASDWKAGYNWCNAVGNWKVDTKRFPNGLGEIADVAHSEGAKFMVWFEPERVVKNSTWAYEHPEFMLLAGGGKAVPHEIDLSYPDSFLLNLGNEDANKWVRESVAKMIRDNGIDYYRQDFNIDPEWFWISNDEPGRKGILENRYILGLYKFWDYLLSEFPGLMIDNCASGGRRLDLETTSRSIALWRTDYNYGEPIGYQCHTYGLSQWLPASGTGLSYSDPFTSRSSFSAAVTFNWSITSPQSNILEMQKVMSEMKSVRGYFYDDFYPLTGYGNTTGDEIWIAYQLNRQSDKTGRIVAFRREKNPDAEIVVKLRGLDPECVYLLENQDSFDTLEKTGKELMDEGLTLHLDNPRSSAFFKYKTK